MKLLQCGLAALGLFAALHSSSHAQGQLFTTIDCSQLYVPGDDPCDPVLVPDVGCFPFSTVCRSESFLPASCGDIYRDVFFEWAPETNGTYYVETCGQTNVDTILVVYPVSPCMISALELDCSDSGCGRQSRVTIEVTNAPNDVYTIRVGSKDGTPDGIGKLCIRRELDLPAKGGMLFATSFGGSNGQPSPSGFVLSLVDTRLPPLPPNPVPIVDTNWSAPMFHNEDAATENVWNAANLGQVFGLTVDNDAAPNVYVSSTTIYGDMTPWPYPAGGFGPGGPAAVYRIDGVTGDISTLLATGPPGWTASQAIGTNLLPNDPVTGPALGDVCYDPDHDQLFVSNFEDGSIYRVSTAGVVLSVLDPFDPDDGTPGFAPIGERVWAVQKRCCSGHGDPNSPPGIVPTITQQPGCGALFFSVWQSNQTVRLRPVFGPPIVGNSVWRIELDASGEFSGSPALVAILPELWPFRSPWPWSPPVSDIAFSGDRMLLAERGMVGTGDYGTDNPGSARVYEYESKWSPSGLAWVQKRRISVGNGSRVSAGGVDYDLDRNVWASSLLMNPFLQGLQRIPEAGNSPATSTTTSYLVDLDGDISCCGRHLVGDVESVSRTCGSLPALPIPPFYPSGPGSLGPLLGSSH